MKPEILELSDSDAVIDLIKSERQIRIPMVISRAVHQLSPGGSVRNPVQSSTISVTDVGAARTSKQSKISAK